MEFHVISEYFNYGVMPILLDAIKVIFKVSVVQGIYYILRSDRKTGIDRIKHATTGYIMFKFIDIFISLIDEVVNNATL